MKCLQGHELPAGNNFCTLCGSAPAHSVPNRIDLSNLEPTDTFVASSPIPSPPKQKKSRRILFLCLASAGLLLVIVIALAAGGGNNSGSTSGSSGTSGASGTSGDSGGSNTITTTAVTSCTLPLYSWVDDVYQGLADNDESELMTVYEEFGEDNSISQWIIQEGANYYREIIQEGEEDATLSVATDIRNECDSLGDPSYPYPG